MADVIIPGITRLKIPLPHETLLMGYVNVYLVNSADDYTLIDTGWGTAHAFNSLKSQLADMGIDLKKIKQVISTHIHPDHYGLSGKLKDISGAKVALHRLDTSHVENRYINMDALLRSLADWLHINGVPDKSLAQIQTASVNAAEFVAPCMPDTVLSGGEVLDAGDFHFKALWTPGHSQGHVCLYDVERKILVSGDHILPTITSHIGRHPQSGDNPLGDYISSLNSLKPLDVQIILPGHENPFTGLQKRIDELIHHHDQRNAEILDKIKSEPRTAYDIATRVIWMVDTGGVSFDKLTNWDKRLAILETLAHLESMRVDGRVTSFNRDGIVYHQHA